MRLRNARYDLRCKRSQLCYEFEAKLILPGSGAHNCSVSYMANQMGNSDSNSRVSETFQRVPSRHDTHEYETHHQPMKASS